MPMTVMTKETHIGDGVYASFDGLRIRLRAPRENGDHVIYLEPHLFRELKRFAATCWPSEKSK
jgi:hypothetical protein